MANGLEKFGLPLLGLAEVIGTKGKSPGTFALTQQQILRQSEQDQQNLIKQAEQAKQAAFQRQLGELQFKKFEREGLKDERREAKLNAIRERLAPEEQELFDLDPQGFVEQRTPKAMEDLAGKKLSNEMAQLKIDALKNDLNDTKKLIPGFSPLDNTKITDDSIKEVKKQAPMLKSIKEQTKRLIQLYNKSGATLTGDVATEMRNIVNRIKLLSKDAVFNLGVLNGPDERFLDGIIPNPSDITQGVLDVTRIRNLETSLKSWQNFILKKEQDFLNINGFKADIQQSVIEPKAPGGADNEVIDQRMEELKKRAREGDNEAIEYLNKKGIVF